MTITICWNSIHLLLCIIHSNCNHFSNDLCKIIVGKEIPSYVNRCAKVASWFSGIANAVADRMNVVIPNGHEDVKEKSSREQSSNQEGRNDPVLSRSEVNSSQSSTNLRTDGERRPSHPTRKWSYPVSNKHKIDAFPSPSTLHSIHFPHVPLTATSLFVPLYVSLSTPASTPTPLLSAPSPLTKRFDVISYVIVVLLSATPLKIMSQLLYTPAFISATGTGSGTVSATTS